MAKTALKVAAAPRGRVIRFGPDEALLGVVTEAAGTPPRIGAILWGLGVAEMKTARRFAQQGIVSLQVRLSETQFDTDEQRNVILDATGVAYCKAAMDKLERERNVDTFILMGNCANANVCFHTAVADPRVKGLILTNPHVSRQQILGNALWTKIMNPRTLRNIVSGRTNFSGNLRSLLALLLGKARGEVAESARAAPRAGRPGEYTENLVLPDDLGERLRMLCARDVNILIACAAADDSFHYLRNACRQALEELSRLGRLRFEQLETDAHVFSTDDAASSKLSDAISRWVHTVLGNKALSTT